MIRPAADLEVTTGASFVKADNIVAPVMKRSHLITLVHRGGDRIAWCLIGPNAQKFYPRHGVLEVGQTTESRTGKVPLIHDGVLVQWSSITDDVAKKFHREEICREWFCNPDLQQGNDTPVIFD